MNSLHVTCAIIENNGRILAAQRSSSMSLPLKWEFPGGKIHDDETPDQCILRELIEELNMDVEIVRSMDIFTHKYPEFEVNLYPYICTSKSSSFDAKEHEKVVWVQVEELQNLDWADADIPIVDAYIELRS